jgi:hypothetical protein
MAVPPLPDLRRLRPLTVGGLRRSRDRRLGDLRALPLVSGWRTEGLLVDLSTRFPVPRLLIAEHAHPELALVGVVSGRPACVASVLLRPADVGRAGARRARDEVVLLTTLEVLGHRPDLVLSMGPRGRLVSSRGEGPLPARAQDLLRRLPATAALHEGDGIAVGDTSVSVVGDWPPRRPLRDVVGARFDLLTSLADALEEGVL